MTESTTGGCQLSLKVSNQVGKQNKEVAYSQKSNNSNTLSDKEVWLSGGEVSNLLGLSGQAVRKNCKSGRYKTRWTKGKGGKQGKKYEILLSSVISTLPEDKRLEYYRKTLNLQSQDWDQLEVEADMEALSRAADYNKKRPHKYNMLFNATAGMKGKELKKYIEEVWNKVHPDMQTCYASVMREKKRVARYGKSSLIGNYGKRAGRTIVPFELLEEFRELYMKEGAPSVNSCWLITKGYAELSKIQLTPFPSPVTFEKALKARIPEEAIYFARYGPAAHNRKYGSYIDRDFSGKPCGYAYVSDHAQVDIAVMLDNDKVCFPWVTAWSDCKSGKWLGWVVHYKDPNSDHIFQSFYYACSTYGIPYVIYIDNGRDYRCTDFVGGRQRYIKVSVDENGNAIKGVTALGIIVIFALPYNAQAKVIERAFNNNKQWLSKHMPGYRGGNVKERPECLKKEIKSGKILKWKEFEELFNYFIINIVNQKSSKGSKILKGMCPDELWVKEHTEKRMVSPDALKLFCMRSSRDLAVGRNGIRDSELDCWYDAPFLEGMKGSKVYMRRDLKAYQTAWVFDAKDNRYIGKAQMTERVSAFANEDMEKEQLKEAMAEKRRKLKVVKAYVKTENTISPQDKIVYMAEGIKASNRDRGYEPSKDDGCKIINLIPTVMDDVVRQAKEQEGESEYMITRGEDEMPVFFEDWRREEWLKEHGIAVNE